MGAGVWWSWGQWIFTRDGGRWIEEAEELVDAGDFGAERGGCGREGLSGGGVVELEGGEDGGGVGGWCWILHGVGREDGGRRTEGGGAGAGLGGRMPPPLEEGGASFGEETDGAVLFGAV